MQIQESIDADFPEHSLSRRQVLIALMAGLASPGAMAAGAGRQAPAGFSLQGTVYERVGRESSIDPVLLYAISCVESAVDGSRPGYIRPYPWTLRYGSRPFYGRSRQEAASELGRILGRGISVDIGLAQINSAWHGHRVKSLYDLLEPRTNLTVAAQILNEQFRRYPKNAFRAIGAYHSMTPERSIRYARHVARLYAALKGA